MFMSLLFSVHYKCVSARRCDPHHHDGPSPERNPGLLQLSRRQPESFSLPHPVHPGGGEASITDHRLATR